MNKKGFIICLLIGILIFLAVLGFFQHNPSEKAQTIINSIYFISFALAIFLDLSIGSRKSWTYRPITAKIAPVLRGVFIGVITAPIILITCAIAYL